MAENQSEMYLNRVLEIYEKILPTIQSIHEDIVSLDQSSLRSHESYLASYNSLRDKVEEIYRETKAMPVAEIKEILEYVKIHNKEFFMEFSQAFKDNKKDIQKILLVLESISLIEDIDGGMKTLSDVIQKKSEKDDWYERRFKILASVIAAAILLTPFLSKLVSKWL